jgi:hypothetical protein
MRVRLPVLTPISRGIVLALSSVILATIGAAFFAGAVPAASPQLLESLATIGAILIPAYAIEAAWLMPQLGRGEEYEEWLGFVVGTGIAGIAAIAAGVLEAQHRAAGHSGTVDDVGLAFVVVSLAILAGTLVLQPVLAHRFGEAGEPKTGSEPPRPDPL